MLRAAAALMTSRARRRPTMPSDRTRDYEVCHRKPPRHSRFKKGQFGNPPGRPRGSKNISTLLSEALNEPITVAENSGRRKITMRQAIIKQLVHQAAKANWRAMKILLDLLRDTEGQTEPAPADAKAFTAADEKVIEQLKARLNRNKGKPDD